MRISPRTEWERQEPSAAGFDGAKLARAQEGMEQLAAQREDGRYRVVIVRGGRLVAEWSRGVPVAERGRLASATKSIFSCVLGIAIDEGVIPSADARVADFYPQMLDVPDGTGPKPGRYAFPKDREITFGQLIGNTSGYMKPGEEPGRVFHYQTYGMNILTHAIASAYGLYDPADPDGSPGLKRLMEERLAQPLGADWTYYLMNFPSPPEARLSIFGYYEGVNSTARDMARLGWLWRNGGRWGDRQLVPADWLRRATDVNPDIRAHAPRAQWRYGYGFWTNATGQHWPGLPTDAFAAQGAGRQHIFVCPSLDLVVVQSPGLYENQEELEAGLLGQVVAAVG